MSNIDFWSCYCENVSTLCLGICFFGISVESLHFHMLKGVFNSEFRVQDLILVNIVYYTNVINVFLYYTYTTWGSLDSNGKNFDTFDRLVIISFIDLDIVDNS